MVNMIIHSLILLLMGAGALTVLMIIVMVLLSAWDINKN